MLRSIAVWTRCIGWGSEFGAWVMQSDMCPDVHASTLGFLFYFYIFYISYLDQGRVKAVYVLEANGLSALLTAFFSPLLFLLFFFFWLANFGYVATLKRAESREQEKIVCFLCCVTITRGLVRCQVQVWTRP